MNSIVPWLFPSVFLLSFAFSFAMLSANLLTSFVAALSPQLRSRAWHARPHIPYVDDPDDSLSVFHINSHQQISSYKEVYYFN